MRIEDITNNQRIASLTRMMQALEGSRAPFETLRAIRHGLAETYGPLALMLVSNRNLQPGEFRVVDIQLEGDLTRELDWRDDNQPVFRGGVLADLITDRRPRLVHDVDWSGDPNFSKTLADFGSVIAMPFGSTRLPINWVIMLSPRPVEFTEDDLEQSMLRSILIGSLMESQALAEDLALANEKIDADVRQLADLQQSLLPDPLPQISCVEIAASYLPSGSAGGDWYDFFSLDGQAKPDGKWCFFIADVSGHGLAAAVVMAMTQAILRAHPPDARGPADLLAHANRNLCRMNISGFVTAFLGVYDAKTCRMVYASAGHPAPLLRKQDGRVIVLDGVLTYPMGIFGENYFEEAGADLELGDTLLLYTDGITEARGPTRELFDVPRLARELVECRCSPRDLIDRLRTAVVSFQGGQRPADDQTMVAIRASSNSADSSALK